MYAICSRHQLLFLVVPNAKALSTCVVLEMSPSFSCLAPGGDAGQPRAKRRRRQGGEEVHRWGPFTFVAVVRGEQYHGWQATCPFHRDAGDHPSTHCTKTQKYNTPEERLVVLDKLKAWCLQGRSVAHRARDDLPRLRSHLWQPLRAVTAQRDLDAELATAIDEEAWIRQAVVDAADAAGELEGPLALADADAGVGGPAASAAPATPRQDAAALDSSSASSTSSESSSVSSSSGSSDSPSG